MLVALFLPVGRPPISTLFPYTTLFRSRTVGRRLRILQFGYSGSVQDFEPCVGRISASHIYVSPIRQGGDRKSTRLNSSHMSTSYAVFCLKKKTRRCTPRTSPRTSRSRR